MQKQLTGKFITVEGPDGSGKSSLIKQLAAYLELHTPQPILVTREPGGIKIGEQIRQVILDVNNVEMDARTEALLYAASRRQHLVEKILPALATGKLVLCDRFIDSSLAYQGIARQIDTALIWQINQFAIEGHLPDLTILLDVPAEVGLERIRAARGQRQYDRLDQEHLAFHQMVRQAFLDFAKDNPRIEVIDGQMSPSDVLAKALAILKQHHIILEG